MAEEKKKENKTDGSPFLSYLGVGLFIFLTMVSLMFEKVRHK